METVTSICNLALDRLGCEAISSISDASKPAKVMNRMYEPVRRQVIEMANWSFARRRATLAPEVTAPTFEYAYQFAKPAGLITIWQEYNDEKFVIEGSKILSDSNSLQILYTVDEEDTSLYTPLFVRTFSLMLAADASYSLTQDKALKNLILQEALKTIEDAMTQDSKGTAPHELVFNSFINVRP